MYKKVDINKKNVPYLYYFLIHNLKTLVCGFSIRCMRILLPWAFLSYKPNVYEFLYNLSCQISETTLLTNVEPVLMEEKLCLLFYKQVDVSRFELYRAINSILDNNISNFYDRYGVDFNHHFNENLRLLHVRLMNDNLFTFWVNKRIAPEPEGNLQMDGGKTVTYKYVIQLDVVPVY